MMFMARLSFSFKQAKNSKKNHISLFSGSSLLKVCFICLYTTIWKSERDTLIFYEICVRVNSYVNAGNSAYHLNNSGREKRSSGGMHSVVRCRERDQQACTLVLAGREHFCVWAME